nr:acylphosphatase [Thalassobacillus sp. CUG 92003]
MHAHLIVQGRVQGVGFRATAQQIAGKYNITGWVRNQSDGSVEIEAEGSDKNLESFIQAMKKGPSTFAKVENVKVEKSEQEQGFQSFEVKY